MLLAIETAETACSAALIAGDAVLDERHELVGRGHAERLIPMIMELLAGQRPEKIAVDCGPGSFTGVRVGIAAARALGLGWQVPVVGFSSTALIAASALRVFPHEHMAVALSGGHGQLFIECFQRTPFASLGALVSLYPAEAAAACEGLPLVAGSGAAAIVKEGFGGSGQAHVARAADVRFLDERYRELSPHPIYGREPDARPKD